MEFLALGGSGVRLALGVGKFLMKEARLPVGLNDTHLLGLLLILLPSHK